MTSTPLSGANSGYAASLTVDSAVEADAATLARLHDACAADLTQRYGRGHWSSSVSKRSILHAIKTCCVLVARQGTEIVGTLQLQTKKPWAIDRS